MRPVPRLTIVFGLILIALALVGYFGAPEEGRSPTALIPAGVGVPMLVCGALALKDRLRMHAMHVAVLLALLGALAAGGRGLMKVGTLFSDEPDANRRATSFVLLMAGICLVYVALGVRSFVAARKARQAGEEAG